MDHVVYLDAKANELELLLSKQKSMLIRGAAGRKMPHGRVFAGDVLYLINNNAEGLILARVDVKSVINSEKMSREESIALVDSHANQLSLSKKQYDRWAGKRYLVLIEIDQITELDPFPIDKSGYGNMDDWLPVENIEKLRI
ncbi:MAG: hypothetical protein H8E26_12355 [FCB group bacterium]|nr:hypothetical protein [FCB group bacterium]MBL7028300.1 hypothetical protein [Candidatus Neomarinimicrobiota bacterium]MBL7121619.1 hypothetical protein [Candidatus Neomarinimicrobiota bacterium]